MHHSEVLIVGTGIAGLRLALSLPEQIDVTMITKRELLDSNTRWAQGGIAAAWTSEDSWRAHVDDTMVAGAGLCRREIVEFVARNGKQSVEELISIAVLRVDLKGREDDRVLQQYQRLEVAALRY